MLRYRWIAVIGVATALLAGAGAELRVQGARGTVPLAGGQVFALSVADLEGTTRWYGALFGLSIGMDQTTDQSVRMRTLESDRLTIELLADPRARPAPNAATTHGITKVGFFVTDIDSTLAVLRLHGAAIEGQWLSSRPRNALVRDNSGNLIQFIEKRQANGS